MGYSPLLVVAFLLGAHHAHAVTVYGQQGIMTMASGRNDFSSVTPNPTSVYDPFPTPYTGQSSFYSGYAAYNPIVLAPPPLPSPLPPNQFPITVPNSVSRMPGVSVAHGGDFLGFSIEMSVATQVIGLNGSVIQPPFLNLMALMQERGGKVNCRFGGNTQDYAVVVPSLPDGASMEKDKTDSTNPTDTPTLYLTPEMIYVLKNVSSLVNVHWFLGIPMNDTSHLRLEIAEIAESILGDHLVGFQLGNEPDLYAPHGHRPQNYSQQDYFNEVGVVVNAIQADSNIPVRNNLIVPSVSTNWSPQSVFDTGIITAYNAEIGALSVEHYPDNNCAAAFLGEAGTPADPQSRFAQYLTHASGQGIVGPYLSASATALAAGKPFYMFETNSASCGGFPGVSDSFGSTLWMLDYALQMAYANFTMALVHVGGVDDTYNPFMPPPGNMTAFEQWTVGAIFYASLVVAEAIGSTGTAQVVDLFSNSANEFTPGYAIWENGTLARMVLINFMTDPSGANDYTTTISVGGGQTGEGNGTPAQIYTKSLSASSVAVKYNITWAGQTFGGQGESDGRLRGNETIQTIPCDQTTNSCTVKVPAPGAVLVFFNTASETESTPASTQTFATTVVTRSVQTASVDASVLATSNGHNGQDRAQLGSTSHGSGSKSGAAGWTTLIPGVSTLVAGLAGVYIVMRLALS